MILGLDVSTSIVGVCLLDSDGNIKEFGHIDLRKIEKFCDKCYAVSRGLDSLKVFHNFFEDSVQAIFIEDRLSGFKKGMTSQQTIVKLAGFNGAVRYISNFHFDVEPVMLHPSTVKATMKGDGLIIPKGADKKKLTLEFVCGVDPEFPYEETRNGNPKAWCYDMADAYIVARAGYLKHICKERGS